jgi:putative transcriptional regulator
LGLSQAQFARCFGVSVRTLQDWEQHRHQPNQTARNFLMVIAKETKAVLRALNSFIDTDVA